MQRIKSGLTALAVGIVLLAALDWAAAAATGQSLVLGKWNQADQTTTIKNVGSGPALDIRAKGPALAVHNANRIKNLNADKLDGKDAADLAASKQTVYVYGATSRVGGFTQNLPAQPAGSYLVAYSAQFVGAAGSLGQPQHRDLPHHGLVGVGHHGHHQGGPRRGAGGLGGEPARRVRRRHPRARGRRPGRPRLHDEPPQPAVVDLGPPADPGHLPAHRRRDVYLRTARSVRLSRCKKTSR